MTPMSVKDQNLLNIFHPHEVNKKSVSLLIYSLLPAIFVTKTLESTLVYLLFSFIYLILVTFLGKLIYKTVREELIPIIVPFIFISTAVLVSLLSNAFFINFSKDYNLYIIILSVSALPYMLIADNEKRNIGYSVLNSLQSFLGLMVIMIVIGFFRELLSTGMITFGNYTNIKFQLNLFKDYAMTVFSNPLGAIILLGFIVAIFNKRGARIWNI